MHFQTKTSYTDAFPNQNFSDYDVFPKQKYKNDAFSKYILSYTVQSLHSCNET